MSEREQILCPAHREMVVGPDIKIGNVEKVEKGLEPHLDCSLV